MLLGLPVRDRDYLVLGATVEDFLAAHPAARAVGKAFPVFILDRQEFSFPRGADIEADLLLRDFTVNALATDESGRLFCHPDALEDLRNRVLRPCSARSLTDDPLRILRAARFLAELPGFTPHAELLAAMRQCAPALDQVYAERAGVELRKALAAPRPGDFLRALAQADCLAPWFAEFAHAAGIPAGPPQYHDASLLEHTARVMDALAGDPLRVWMGLCHDIGKTTTDPALLPRHIAHESRGGPLALALGERLRLPRRYIDAGADAARWHMLMARYPELRPGTRVDMLTRLTARGVLREMTALAAADHGEDHGAGVQAELAAIRSVTLPAEARNLGPASGDRLRQLRIQALRGA
jgi:tRNA nucleotidyltransferase (CCA-adding enzyme)